MSQPVVELRAVWKLFGSVVAVQDCSFSVQPGEFVSLLGPSGSGKTTTLRMIAGFERATAGEIHIAGRDVSRVAPKDRDISMVFQNYALFPHMTVAENVAFGPSVRRASKASVRDRVAKYLSLVQLEGFEDRLPRQLSGGQQQRVALARALITEPKVLLLDEPLGALDRKLREQLQVELKELLTRLGATAIYVTHDQDEALVMSDRVAVMTDGQIEQLDRPDVLYERPRTRFVASFVGTSNIFEGTVRRGESGYLLDADGLALPLSAPLRTEGARITAAIRPEKVQVRPAGEAHPHGAEGRVVASRYRGASTLYEIELSTGSSVAMSMANADRARGFRPGERVVVIFPPDHLVVLEDDRIGTEGRFPTPLHAHSATKVAL